MDYRWSTDAVPGAAELYLIGSAPLLRPEEQVFDAMLEGWSNQQFARNLARSTVENRVNAVRAFARHAEAFPWQWSAGLADEWFADGDRYVSRCLEVEVASQGETNENALARRPTWLTRW